MSRGKPIAEFRKAVQTLNMEETAAYVFENLSGTAYGHVRPALGLLQKFDYRHRDGRPLCWENEFTWYKAINGAYRRGLLDGTLKTEEKRLMEEAQLGVVTEEDILLGQARRLVDFRLLSPVGRMLYGNGICHYLANDLLSSVPIGQLLGGDTGSLGKQQLQELHQLGLLRRKAGPGGRRMLTPMGEEALSYLRVCTLASTADRGEALEQMGNFWYERANKEKEPARRVGMFLKAARILGKPHITININSLEMSNPLPTPDESGRLDERDEYSLRKQLGQPYFRRGLVTMATRAAVAALASAQTKEDLASVVEELDEMGKEQAIDYVPGRPLELAREPLAAAKWLTMMWRPFRKEVQPPAMLGDLYLDAGDSKAAEKYRMTAVGYYLDAERLGDALEAADKAGWSQAKMDKFFRAHGKPGAVEGYFKGKKPDDGR